MPKYDPNASVRALDREMELGAHLLYCDSAAAATRAGQFPIGQLAAGQSLLEFWQLRFPIQGIDYNQPEVLAILRTMLGIRAMDPCHVLALTTRINSLSDKYGRDGYGMAMMLMSRARQALADPYAFPGLMSDDELRDAYRTSGRIQNDLQIVSNIVGGKSLIQATGKNLGSDAGWRAWLRAAGSKLDAVDAAVSKYTTTAGSFMLGMWTSFILGSASKDAGRDKLLYRDEMLRRNIEVPK